MTAGPPRAVSELWGLKVQAGAAETAGNLEENLTWSFYSPFAVCHELSRSANWVAAAKYDSMREALRWLGRHSVRSADAVIGGTRLVEEGGVKLLKTVSRRWPAPEGCPPPRKTAHGRPRIAISV
jgi:hypothetical protein